MRKQLAVIVAAIAFVFAANASSAQARDAVYRAVAIDTSRIAATGHRHFAAAIKPILAGELSKALGPRLGRGGSQLIVRLTHIRIPPNAGDESSDVVIEDTLEGVVIVPGRAPIPIRIVLPPSSAGAWYLDRYDERRVYRLLEAFAQWTARAV